MPSNVIFLKLYIHTDTKNSNFNTHSVHSVFSDFSLDFNQLLQCH